MILRPTAALVRASVVAAVTVVIAVWTSRPELVVFGAGFLCWVVLGVWRRPGGSAGIPAVVEPTEQVSSRRLSVGQTTRISVTTGSDDLVAALHLARPPRCDVEPPLGATVGVGTTAVDLRVQRWGRHQVSASATQFGDTWGLWSGIWSPRATVLRVSPEIGAPGRGEAIPHPTGLVGIHPSRARGEGSSLAEIRAFVTGDRLRRINWRVTSRTGTLHTNATTAERDTEVVIVTDTLSDISVIDGGRTTRPDQASSLDITVAAAAGVSDHFLRLGDRVGVHDLGYVIGPVPPGAGSRQRAIVVEQLAKASAERIGVAGMRRLHRVRTGSLAICCTPLIDPDVTGEILRLAHRGAAVLVIDTLPPGLGTLGATPTGWWDRFTARVQTRGFWDEAWALRRLEREVELERLRTLGIPVIGWQGIQSLAQMITVLATSRSAPRMVRR